ncbi:MAG: DUF3791 domain-containing protein [Synergistaceae bacterium]|jgi:hypothetical protein|nr:DUF3791 domain-containing protein [Synergistaceae bacterium]
MGVDKKTKFLIYCMEIYKHAKHLTGKQVLERFIQYNLFDYVLEFYEILHVHGVRYILQDIDEYIVESRSGSEERSSLAPGTRSLPLP